MNPVPPRAGGRGRPDLVSRTHYNVEIEHWLLEAGRRTDTDIAAILRHYEIDQVGSLTMI